MSKWRIVYRTWDGHRHLGRVTAWDREDAIDRAMLCIPWGSTIVAVLAGV